MAEEATATGGAIPKKINNGVAINPPPIPNIPDRIPPDKPMSNRVRILIGMSAIGKYISMIV